MAQIKRKKVSGKAVHGQKKDLGKLLHNKTFVITMSIVLGILVAAGIGLGIYFGFFYNKDDDETKYYDYLGDTQTYTVDGKDYEVEFTRMSYAGAVMHLSPEDYENDRTYVKHVFFFAYDLTTFYADDRFDEIYNDDDKEDVIYYNKDHKLALEALTKIQYYVDTYNKTAADDEKAVLYIIDTSYANNIEIFYDPTFGGGDENVASFTFGYVAGEDGFQKEFKNQDGQTKSLTATTMNDFYYSATANIVKFVTENNFDLNLD